MGEVLKAGAFREVFSNSAAEVLVLGALPGGVRVREIGWDFEGVGELLLESVLRSVVGRH